jgi:hypothetical protein
MSFTYRLLLAMLVTSLSLTPPAVNAQFPEREPTNAELVFGCDPGPIEPFYGHDPAIPPARVPDDTAPLTRGTLVVDGSLALPPIDGAGFNLEHALWSCPTFRPSLRRRILEPFRPSVARVDTGQLPLAPGGVPAEELDWQDYQAIMADPRYQPSWEFIRRLNEDDVRVMLGVWGAPGAFTHDGTRRGILLPRYHDKYVEYYTAVVDYLVRVQGLEVWSATVMNEPDGGDGTFIPPDEFVELARKLGPSLAQYGVQLYGPDTASAENALEYLPGLMAEPEVMSHFAAVATHQYYPSPFVERLVASVAASDYAHLPVYVTEYTSFTYGEMDRGQEASDEVGTLLDVAETAASLYNDGIDAALYWDAVDYYQAGHAAITKWGLLRGPEDAFFPRKRYFGLLQMLPYLQPGAQVLNSFGRDVDELTALAVRTPGDGRDDLAIVLVNKGGPTMLDLYLQALDDIDELHVYLTDDENNQNHLGHLEITAGQAQLYVPARSIVTLAPAAAPDESLRNQGQGSRTSP